MNPLWAIKYVFLKVLTIFLSVFLFAFVPASLILFTPIFLYRYLIHILIFCKTFVTRNRVKEKLLDARSTIFAVDSLYYKPKSSIVIANVLKGDLEFSKIFSRAQKIIDDDVYPQLKQCLTIHFSGFYCWKSVKNFQLRRHLKQLNPIFSSRVFNGEDVQRIRLRLLHKPYTKDQPLWEVLLLNNVVFDDDDNFDTKKQRLGSGQKHSVLFFRIHHCVADGYSLLNFVNETNLLDSSPELEYLNGILNNYKNSQQQTYFNPFRIILFPFWCAIEVSSTIVERSEYLFKAKQPARTRVRSLSEDPISGLSDANEVVQVQLPQYYLGLVDNLTISTINKIKRHFGVSFSAVILALISGGVRELALRKFNQISGSFSCLTIIPLPDHPARKLTNHMTGGVTILPINESDPEKRLYKCFQTFKSISHSTFPTFSNAFLNCVGSLFPAMTRFLARNVFTSGGISNMPGSSETVCLDALPIIDIQIVAGLQAGNTGIGFCGISHVGNFRMTVVADSSVLTEDEVRLLAQYISNQLKLYESQMNTK